jgi:hypothetical protein
MVSGCRRGFANGTLLKITFEAPQTRRPSKFNATMEGNTDAANLNEL